MSLALQMTSSAQEEMFLACGMSDFICKLSLILSDLTVSDADIRILMKIP